METFDPHKSTTEVRQGDGRKMNMRVLTLGLVGIIVLFAAIYGVYVLWPEGGAAS